MDNNPYSGPGESLGAALGDLVHQVQSETGEPSSPSATEPPSSKPCKYCNKPRNPIAIFNVLTRRHDAYIYPACECSLRVREEIDARFRREAANASRMAAFPYAPPPRLAGASFDNFEPQTTKQARALENFQDYVARAEDRIAQGQGAYLWGVTGTGKSHLMVATGNALHMLGYHVIYYNVAELLMRLKGSGRLVGNDRELDLVKMLGEADVLLLDDIGKETGWDSELSKLHTILDHRVGALKPTWFTSELSINDLARHLGRYVNGFMSRLLGTVEVFEFDGKDQRGVRRVSWKK